MSDIARRVLAAVEAALETGADSEKVNDVQGSGTLFRSGYLIVKNRENERTTLILLKKPRERPASLFPREIQ